MSSRCYSTNGAPSALNMSGSTRRKASSSSSQFGSRPEASFDQTSCPGSERQKEQHRTIESNFKGTRVHHTVANSVSNEIYSKSPCHLATIRMMKYLTCEFHLKGYGDLILSHTCHPMNKTKQNREETLFSLAAK